MPRALQSVLHQTFSNYELLVIDNGSTDDTSYVVKRIQDPRIRYILHSQPSSSCDAPRNLGIELARGQYISFLDDDDIWYPLKLERVKKGFDENPLISAICHSENIRVYGKINRTAFYGPWNENFYETLLYDGNCLSPSAMTLKAEVLKELKGFTLKKEFDAFADYDFWLRMAASQKKIYFIREPLGESGMTGINESKIISDGYLRLSHIVKEHLLSHEKKPLFKISQRGCWRLFHLYILALPGLFKAARYKKVLKCIFQSFFLVMLRPSLLVNIVRKLKQKVLTG